MMKKIINFLFIFNLLSAALIAQPKIKVYPHNVLDLGDLFSGVTIEQSVTIKNEGTETLHIQDIKSSCGCTAALMKEGRNDIPPHESAQLSIEFDTKDLSGSVTKYVEVFSNDTVNPKVKVLFSSFVIERLKITPPQIYFNLTNPDSDYSFNVTLKNQTKDKTIKILNCESQFDSLKFHLNKKIITPGDEVVLKTMFRPPNLEPHAGTIEITTDLPMQNKFKIAVFSWKAENK